jgi:hypothetical protein
MIMPRAEAPLTDAAPVKIGEPVGFGLVTTPVEPMAVGYAPVGLTPVAAGAMVDSQTVTVTVLEKSVRIFRRCFACDGRHSRLRSSNRGQDGEKGDDVELHFDGRVYLGGLCGGRGWYNLDWNGENECG